MIGFIIGERGQGKTKRIINMANSKQKESEGHVVFIDDNKSHMHSLHSNIRFVEAKDYNLHTYRELIGFIYGMLALDSDISEIFIDSMSGVVKSLDNDEMVAMSNQLKTISKTHNVNFVIAISCNDSIPDEIQALSL